MNLLQTKLAGVFVAETTPFVDHRGIFSRLYCQQELATVIGKRQIVQINYSQTRTVGAVRGLHYQHPPHAEMKLVRCLKGRVFDVAVDLRASSPTFLQWHGEELTPSNGRMLVVPEGFAHGFQVLEADSEILYLVTAFYEPEMEGGVSYNDSSLKIEWPMPVTDLSERDCRHPPITPDFSPISV